MKLRKTNINGVFEIILEPNKDDRGSFTRLYDNKLFEEYNLNTKWVQTNYSYSKKKGTIRGLHFQYKPSTEVKLVYPMKGKAYFAIVDIRKDSVTFGKYIGITVEENKNGIYIPKGCANGFCTLTDNCVFHYSMSEEYNSSLEDNLRWDDKELNIEWPLECKVISDRDRNAQTFEKFKKYRGGL